MKRQGKLALRMALALSIASGVFGGLAVKYSDHLLVPSYASEMQDAKLAREQLAKDTSHARGLSDDFTSVAKALRPSVVHINSITRMQPTAGKGRVKPQIPEEFRKHFGMNDEMLEKFFENQAPQAGQEQRGQGTGVIVSEDGYIVTNNHVIRGATELNVRLSDGREFTGKVIGQDDKTDVAVIKIEATNLMPAPLGNSDAMEVGEWVLAIGSPFGLDQTVTSGIISAKGRANVGITDYEDFLQTDAAINPGNSGGPLVNMHGEVVGINTAIASRSGGSMGVGFAIPSNMVKHVSDSLMKDGKVTRGWLGAAIQDLTDDLAKSFNFTSTEGVLIGDVVPDSPAAKAGLKAGDIVTKLNGRALHHAHELRHAVAATKPGSSAELTIFRDGKAQALPVVIGKLDANISLASANSTATPEAEAADDLGITVQDLNADMAKELGLTKATQGVVIVKVDQGSLAAEVGIQRGDVVASVAGQPVKSVAEYRDALKKHSLEKGVRMQVSRDGVSRFVFLRAQQ